MRIPGGDTHITSDMCTPFHMAAVLCVSPLGSAVNYIVDWRCDNSICILVKCVPLYTYC